MAERRYNEDEVAQIFERATEAQQGGRAPLAATDGMSLAELQQIGKEVGLSPEAVTQAARSLDRVGQPASRRLLGLPVGVGRTVELGRRLTDDDWDRLVVNLRETFDARGIVRAEGGLRSWTNGNLQIMLEPGESGHRLRMRTLHGASLGYLTAGLATVSVGVISLMLRIATGGSISVTELAAFAAIGASLFAIGALRLPSWAAERRRQMEDIARRLTE